MSELAEALEMVDYVTNTDVSAKLLLQRWKKEMALLKSPARKHLMYHLTNIGMQHLQER